MRLLLLPTVFMAFLGLAAPAQAPEHVASDARWEGEWGLVAEVSDRLETRIEEHLKGRNIAMQLLWKRKLQGACRTYPSLDILLGPVCSVTFGKELPADSGDDGSSREWRRSDGARFQVSAKRTDASLTQTFRGNGYTLTYDYTLPKDTEHLLLQVTYASPKREAPFTYRQVYRKRR